MSPFKLQDPTETITSDPGVPGTTKLSRAAVTTIAQRTLPSRSMA